MSGTIVVAGEDLGTLDPWEAIASLVAERRKLRVLVTTLRLALAEAAGHVEAVDQNSELAIGRWQALAAGETEI